MAVLPLRRGPPRPDAPGALPAGGRQPDPARLRHRGHAARRADRGPAGPRRRAARRRSATCARASTRSFILLARLSGWPLETYWQPEHPPGRPIAARSPRAFGRRAGEPPDARSTAAGSATYAFPLREVARALRPPGRPVGRPGRRPAPRAGARTDDRSATRCWPTPRWSPGSRDRLDTSLMKALPGRIVSKAGMEALRGLAILPGPRATASTRSDRPGDQDRGRRRLRAGDLGGDGRGAPPGRRARRAAAARARPLPPAGLARPARAGRRPRRSPSSTSRRSAS